MAFDMDELSLMAYTGATDEGNHQYRYANSEEDDLTEGGFFDEASHQLRVNDTIYDQYNRVIYAVDSVNDDGEVTVSAIGGGGGGGD